MEIELERTFLLKELPKDLEKCKSVEIFDIYLPFNAVHPVLRIRRKGDIFEITKKQPIKGNDSSEQSESTIYLSPDEFSDLSKTKGKEVRKIRYYYPMEDKGVRMEVDIFKDELKGLAMVDFEFDSVEAKNNFKMPGFCLADVTQDKYSAGGILAGKKYSDVEPFFQKYGYNRINP